LDELITGWHGQGPIHLPGGLHAFRVSGRLRIEGGTATGTTIDDPPTDHARQE
jgi:tRNA(Ile)-lysidine synthase